MSQSGGPRRRREECYVTPAHRTVSFTLAFKTNLLLHKAPTNRGAAGVPRRAATAVGPDPVRSSPPLTLASQDGRSWYGACALEPTQSPRAVRPPLTRPLFWNQGAIN